MKNKVKWFIIFIPIILVSWFWVLTPATPAQNPADVYRPSGSGGAEPDKGSDNPAVAVTNDVVYLAFSSEATNLAGSDTNRHTDIFVASVSIANWPSQTALTRITPDSSNGDSWDPTIAVYNNNCYRVAFVSSAGNLVAGDSNGWSDVFVYDSCTNSTERISLSSSGVQANNLSHQPDIAANGQFVAFTSLASNLVEGDTTLCDTDYDGQADDSCADIFVHDLSSDTTTRVSVSNTGLQATNSSWQAAISQSGRYISFESLANNLVKQDNNSRVDIFVRDREANTTTRASVKSGNNNEASHESTHSDIVSNPANPNCYWVVFESQANLANVSGGKHIYLRDNCNSLTELISRASTSTGAPANSVSGSPSISNDGCLVVFESWATSLVPDPNDEGATDNDGDIFMRNRCNASPTTTRISVHDDDAPDGRQGVDDSIIPVISLLANGKAVIPFKSRTRNMVSGDSNLATDIFAFMVQP